MSILSKIKLSFLLFFLSASLILSPLLSVNKVIAGSVPWIPEVGDRFEINVETNMGYLVHSDGSQISFELLTGQLRTLCFANGCYFAKTPKWNSVVKKVEVKGNRYTFGLTGRFLRLYQNGDKRTPYGIHSHKYFQSMLDSNNHNRSWGCILVSDEILDLLEEIMSLNNGSLNVLTY